MPAKIKMNKNVVLKNLKKNILAAAAPVSFVGEIPEVEIQGYGQEHQDHVDPLSSQEDHLDKDQIKVNNQQSTPEDLSNLCLGVL